MKHPMELLNNRRMIAARRATVLAVAFLVLCTNANEDMCTAEYKPVVCSRGMAGTGVSTGGGFGASAEAGAEFSASRHIWRTSLETRIGSVFLPA